MKRCPYCLGDVEDAARKCVHCGEWVEPQQQQPAAGPPSDGSIRSFFESQDLDQTLNTGIKWYVKYRIAAAIIGLIVFLIFFLTVFLPSWNDAQSQFDNFPGGGNPSMFQRP